jgi:uncharacterized membrane protein
MSGFTAFIFMVALLALLEILTRIGIHLPGLATTPARLRASLAAMFVFTGTAHFYATDIFVESIPSFLPLRTEAVLLSGVAEIAGAIALLVPQLRRVSGIGLALLLLAVFPANINVAVNNLQLQLFPTEATAQWIRLLVQPILIGLVLWSTETEREPAPRATLVAAGVSRH